MLAARHDDDDDNDMYITYVKCTLEFINLYLFIRTFQNRNILCACVCVCVCVREREREMKLS